MSENRLLIIDDEQDICDFIADVAEPLGFAVQTARTYDRFLNVFDQFDPTLVVLDLMMPDADGIEVLRVLADKKCRSEIILSSGADARVLNSTARLGVSEGLRVRETLAKPLDLEALEGTLKKYLKIDSKIGEHDLSEAIAAGDLVVQYQPKVDLQSDCEWHVVGVEALVRWNHREHGILPPDRFIPIAEQTGLIVPLTEWVIDTALSQAAELRDAGWPLAVAVNVSPQILTDLEAPDRLSEKLKAHGLDGSRLILEITESAMMASSARTMDILTRFRLKGMELAMDDFGTGYSSLIQLYRLPFSELKIDKQFVIDFGLNSEAKVIIKSIIDLARNLGLTVVAEGIETKEALEFLKSVGCDHGQGYLISRPVAATDLKELLGRWRSTPEIGKQAAVSGG